ncbi:MAG TPA: TRAP transporter substrate-binding protein [Candidatus Xenobia bacterium]
MRAWLLVLMLVATLPASARTLHLLLNNPPGTAIDRGVRHLQAEVEHRSHGQLHLAVHPLGDWHGHHLGELAIVQAVRDGDADMAVVTSAPLVNYAPEMRLLDAPFLFNRYGDADTALDGLAGQHLLASLGDHGLHGLAFWDGGFRMLALVHPWRDLTAQRVRIMESPMYETMMKLLGAVPIPSDIVQVHDMLKAGYIDAVDTSYPPILECHMDDICRYVVESRHGYAAKVVFMNATLFNGLPPDQQQVLSVAARVTAAWERRAYRAEERTARARCRARGMSIEPLPPADRQQMRKACQPIYDALARQFSEPWERALLSRSGSIRSR